jgi:hypothetical protein
MVVTWEVSQFEMLALKDPLLENTSDMSVTPLMSQSLIAPFTPPPPQPAPFDANAKFGQLPLPDSVKHALTAETNSDLLDGVHTAATCNCIVHVTSKNKTRRIQPCNQAIGVACRRLLVPLCRPP